MNTTEIQTILETLAEMKAETPDTLLQERFDSLTVYIKAKANLEDE